MTELRNQLRLARSTFRLARYPGDLAAELLPVSTPAKTAASCIGPRRRWLVTSAGVAAAVMVTFLLLRPSMIRSPSPAASAGGGWVSLACGPVPLPRFEPPALPVTGRDLRLPLPAGVEHYQDLAMRYRDLPVPESLPESIRHTTVPTIPADLPTRGLEWLHKVWTGGAKSA